MSTVKQQHTIPKAYLNWFAENDGRISVYSKRQSKHLRPLPENILVRYHYYSQPENGIQNANQAFEKIVFGSIENKLPKLKEQLEEAHTLDLDLLLDVLFSLAVRTTAFREPFELALSDYVQNSIKAIDPKLLPTPPKGHEDILSKVTVTIDPHRSIHAMAHYLQDYVALVAKFNFKIYSAPKNKTFLTSDNPVVWLEHIKNRNFPNIYPKRISPASRVVFPISPQKILIGKPAKSGDVEFSGNASVLTKQQVNYYNAVQLACSWDFTVGTAKLPKQTIERFSFVAPKYKIDFYDPDTNKFILSKVLLDRMREKVKHKYD